MASQFTYLGNPFWLIVYPHRPYSRCFSPVIIHQLCPLFLSFLVERCSTFCCFGHGWPSRCALLEAEVLRAPGGAAEHLVLLAGRDGPQRVGHRASSRAPQGGQGQHWVNYE